MMAVALHGLLYNQDGRETDIADRKTSNKRTAGYVVGAVRYTIIASHSYGISNLGHEICCQMHHCHSLHAKSRSRRHANSLRGLRS